MSEVEILRVIMETNPGLCIDDALKMADKAIKSLSRTKADIAKGNTAMKNEEESSDESEQQPGHTYTKSDLKVSPVAALHGDKVTCCLCSKKFEVITKTHLWSQHQITPEDYRELCGYTPDTKLMSASQLQKKRELLTKGKPWEKTERWQLKHPKAAPLAAKSKSKKPAAVKIVKTETAKEDASPAN